MLYGFKLGFKFNRKGLARVLTNSVALVGKVHGLVDDETPPSLHKKSRVHWTYPHTMGASASRSFKENVTTSRASNIDGNVTNVVATKELSPLPTMTQGKRYRGFLSHFKYECGTEARLVHREMGEMMPGEDIFLDSGT